MGTAIAVRVCRKHNCDGSIIVTYTPRKSNKKYGVTTVKQLCLAEFETGYRHCSNSARRNKKFCRRSKTACRCTPQLIHIFEISYYSFEENSSATLKQKVMILD
jgi:hypothetical protein